MTTAVNSPAITLLILVLHLHPLGERTWWARVALPRVVHFASPKAQIAARVSRSDSAVSGMWAVGMPGPETLVIIRGGESSA